jgi:DnaK suppressor protein
MQKDKLLKYESLIKNKIKEISSRSTDVCVDSDGDELDQIQSSLLISMAYDYNDRNNNTLNLLHIALDKINNNEYGLCEDCGEEISEKRLNIFPEVRLCISCAESAELEKSKK